MIGSMSSSLSLAQRTASKARVTMDTMSRQIATGQKVSSAKDDGAAWTRAAGLRGQLVATEALRNNVSMFKAVLGANTAGTESRMMIHGSMLSNATAAMDSSLSASARAALQAEQSIPSPSQSLIASASHGMNSSTGSSFWFNSRDVDNRIDFVASETGAAEIFQGIGHPNWIPGSITDLSTVATAGVARQALSETLDMQRGRLSYWSAVDRRLDRLDQSLASKAQSIETMIGSLTDADLGKASTARANAETRQQLALSTISQAISAYGSYANGLLGNVARTQRGVMA
jgi:flagellin